MYDLRAYQQDLVARVREAFRQYRRVLMVSPTGSGKTIVFAYVTTAAATKGKRVTVIAHRTEIVAQISAALDAMGVKHGRIQPGHTMTDDPVQVAMIQTLARREIPLPPDFLIVDEAHHCVSKTYDQVCSRWPKAKILGVTATPKRLDGKGLGRLYEAMILGPTTGDLIRAGWLAKYTYLAPPVKVDLSKVKTTMGDYQIDQLAEAMDKAVITGDAIQHYRDHLFPRSAIVFTVRVDHAEHVAKQFLEAGIRSASVDGTMDRATRRDRIEGLADGRYQILTSCALISEGLDVPSVGGVILLRPTKSLSVYLQQIGRALRPKPDKSPAVVLDHVGNIHTHGLPDAPRQWTLADKKKRDAAAPTQQCEVCFRVFDSFPGWKKIILKAIEDEEEADCSRPDHPECLLRNSAGAAVASPEVVDGKLSVVNPTPEWAGGLNIVSAHGNDWYRMMGRADTLEKLQEIGRARGYHWKWAKNVWAAKQKAGAV